MLNLHAADLATLGLYLLGVTVLGIMAARRVKQLSDFVMPRKFGKWFMLMHGFGTSTHSDQAVSVASKTFTNGLSGIWYQWMWLFATPFFWLIAPMMRRFRALTTADVFEARFDQSVAVLYSILGLAKFMVGIALMLKGSAVIIEASTDGAVSATVIIPVITVMFVAYGMAGGLRAAIVTDFVQGILTLLFSFLLLPMVLNAVGGIDGMKETIGAIHPEKNMFSLIAPEGITVFFIVMISINSLLGVVVQPHNMGTCGAGKTEIEGAVGFMGGTLLKRVCTVAWCLTGLGAIAFYGTENLPEPDLVYGAMAREFLPQILPGLLGLFIAALLATVMGSCDSFMIASSGLVSQNIYRPLVPGKPDRHYLKVARFSSLIVVVGGVVIAFSSDSVVSLLEKLWVVNTIMAMAFWLGIFWRRTTVAGAWAATLATLGMWGFSSTKWGVAFFQKISGPFEFVVEKKGELVVSLPWQMLFYIIAGFLAGIVVSLFTKRVSAEKLDNFYGLLRTPVQPDEEIPAPCRLPEDVEPGPRRVFFPNTELEIPKPGKRAILGFLVGWAVVGAIIAGVAVWIAE
ncbi:MAG: sodium:solute symporter family protein [Verrucomicrobiales bacterium]|nr:sodium:solute symporter family protein [Verrucomicrobiales bacterium]